MSSLPAPPLYLGQTVSVIGNEFKFNNSSATTTQSPNTNYDITNKMYVDDKVNEQKIRIDNLTDVIGVDIDKLKALKEWLDSLDIDDLTNTLLNLSERIVNAEINIDKEIADRELAIQSIIDMVSAEFEARTTSEGLINTRITEFMAQFDTYVLSNNTRSTNIETSVLNEAAARVLEDNSIKQTIATLETNIENDILSAKTEAMNHTTELNAAEALTRSNADIEINASLLAVSGKLDIEIANRIADVNNLQLQIDQLDSSAPLDLLNTEIADRIAADIALENKINSEKSTRETDISTLRDRIATEENTRSLEDVAIKKKIDDEISDRSIGYTELGNRITSEEESRGFGDQALGNRITAEETARLFAFSTLRDNLATETETRISEDTILRYRIAAEEVARDAKDTILQNQINDEVIARDAKDTLLQNKINDEAIARDAKDTILQKQIEDEVNIRETSFNTLNSQIENFTSLITDEASIRSAAITSLQTGLADEITIRINTDNTLQTLIDAEVLERKHNENKLEDEIIELKALLKKMETDNKTVIDDYYNKINALYLTFWHKSMDYSTGVDQNFQMTFYNQYGPGNI